MFKQHIRRELQRNLTLGDLDSAYLMAGTFSFMPFSFGTILVHGAYWHDYLAEHWYV